MNTGSSDLWFRPTAALLTAPLYTPTKRQYFLKENSWASRIRSVLPVIQSL